jgi:hypothetical protein
MDSGFEGEDAHEQGQGQEHTPGERDMAVRHRQPQLYGAVCPGISCHWRTGVEGGSAFGIS